jgi:ribokinase
MVALFTAGGVIVDTVVSADGTLGPRTMGGNAVYSAAGARLWLDGVGIVARVPANYPRAFLERLEQGGIDLSGIRFEAAEVTENEWFFYREDGSRADHLHGDMAAPLPAEPGTRLSREQAAELEDRLRRLPATGNDFAAFRRRHPVRLEDVPPAYLSAAAVHLAANGLAEQLAMTRALSGAGLRVSVDPGSNAGGMIGRDMTDSQSGESGIGAIMAAATAFLPSEKELRCLAPGLAREEAFAALQARGPAALVAKLGAEGSLHRDADGTLRLLPVFPVRAVDPTGAGDAFCGGFLAGLVLLGDLSAAACLGTISASFAVESFGPFHLLGITRPAARARLDTFLASLEP